MTARSVCMNALLCVDENEGYSNIVIDKELRKAALDPRDSALASTIFYGVLEREITLDHYIRKFLKNPRQKLEAGVAILLRMAVYQILYLDRIPDSAAVNEAVALAKETGRGKYAGFINGVLRSFLRGKESLSLPSAEDDFYLHCSVAYSIPVALVRLWDESYGREKLLPLLEALSSRAGLFIRVNTLKTDDEKLLKQLEVEGCTAVLCDFVPHCIRIDRLPGKITDLPSFEQGLFHVQDTASQLLCSFVAPQPGTITADVCAAPGGKSFTMAQYMGGSGSLLAFDLYKGRVRLIKDGALRLDIHNIETKVRDAATAKDDFLADTVLCDVPCSGFGVIRRKPEIRRKDPAQAKELPPLQYAILCNAAERVCPGGRLVYSTCTLHPAENGEIAARFLREHPEFEPEPIDFAHAVDEPAYMLTMLPGKLDTDGFFAARFRRKKEIV